MSGFFSRHIGRCALSISSKKRQRRLGDIVPQAHDGLQANSCRTPDCSNFGVPPRRLDPNSPNPRGDRLGAYALFGPEGDTMLKCGSCHRFNTLFSNVALATEINRLRTANGIFASDSCPSKSCLNHGRAVDEHLEEYYGHGVSASGAVRKRCKRCKSTLTLSNHYRSKTAGSVNKDIVRDLVNRGALNAIIRKLQIAPTTVYDRIDFIRLCAIGGGGN